jgi:ATP-binding cassette subfamily B protein
VGKLIIDHVVRVITHRTSDTGQVWLYLSIEIGLVIASDILGRLGIFFDSLLGDKFTSYLSLRLMEHAGAIDLMTLENADFQDKLERARRQTAARIGMLASLAGGAQQALTLLSLSAAVISFSPWFLALMVAAVIPSFLGETHFAMLAYSILFRWTPQRRELDYLRLLGASNQSAKEVKAFGLASYLIRRAQGLFEEFYETNKRLAIKRSVSGALLNLLPTAGFYAAYVLILIRTLGGTLSLGDMTFLAGSFARSRSIIEGLFSSFNTVTEQAFYLKDLFDFLDTPPSIVSKPNALQCPRPIRSGFEFCNVSFAYSESSKKVLNGISFRFDRGERIALIGENGTGKTTLVKLLSRLYDPTEGKILLDGVDLREYEPEDLRKEIGVIFQDFMRYDMPLKDNIGFGRIEELTNQYRIEQAARKSLANSLVEKLPGGYEQMLGRRFENGVELSAGQWQKIALARAYMRDAQVLILDEPTASLDARAEFEVFVQFTELTRDKMALLISHRFSTVRMADRILVLAEGTVKEQGTHDQLLAINGRYAELFKLQAAGYQ